MTTERVTFWALTAYWMQAGRDAAPALKKSLSRGWGGLDTFFFLPPEKLSQFSRQGVGASSNYIHDTTSLTSKRAKRRGENGAKGGA